VFFFGPKFCTNVEIKSKREYFITILFLFLGGGDQISKTWHKNSTLILEKGHFSYQPLNFEQDLRTCFCLMLNPFGDACI
jgi:hypothetical protein